MVRPRLRGPLAPGPPPPPRHRSILWGPHLELLEKAQLTNVEEGRVNRVYHNLCTGKASQWDAIFPRIPECMTARPASGAQTANAGPKVCRCWGSPSVSRPCFLGTGPPVPLIGCRLRTRLRDRRLGPQVARLNAGHREAPAAWGPAPWVLGPACWPGLRQLARAAAAGWVGSFQVPGRGLGLSLSSGSWPLIHTAAAAHIPPGPVVSRGCDLCLLLPPGGPQARPAYTCPCALSLLQHQPSARPPPAHPAPDLAHSIPHPTRAPSQPCPLRLGLDVRS
ncbi:unnamed protein product [Rangifer tarandus platyrhynchus]|uniref:Uncharacterized protein n=1 Tax=Rangifer tarandus platyrhynchus TaxID=3082113 RepID=A0ABN9A1Q7_RANTA|nr:unnamed protein product [Rangifer tarandus platyrhynchus]